MKYSYLPQVHEPANGVVNIILTEEQIGILLKFDFQTYKTYHPETLPKIPEVSKKT